MDIFVLGLIVGKGLALPALMTIDLTTGHSAAARDLSEQVGRAAASHAPVLLRGESGSGKEILAHAIHAASARASGPFVATGCLLRTDVEVEVDLFGCDRGAVPGVTADRIGLFEAANGGTLFIEELADVPPWLQARILRALEEREFRRVGSSRAIPLDCRLISATNRDLGKLVTSGVVRRDFYYRIQIIEIELPPLRHRREDIPLLVEQVLQVIATDLGRSELRVAPEAVEWLKSHLWAGNVRELRNVLERAAVRAHDGEIQPEDLSAGGHPWEVPSEVARTARSKKDASEERGLIEAALRDTCGNRSRAAMLLGISRITLWKKMRRLGMPPVSIVRRAEQSGS